MVERAFVVIQPEQQRADDAFTFFVPAEAGDDAVGGARVLDLEHRALAGLYGPSTGFAITPSRPAPSKRDSHSAAIVLIARHRREMNRRRGIREQRFERAAAFGLRTFTQILAVSGQQIEADER